MKPPKGVNLVLILTPTDDGDFEAETVCKRKGVSDKLHHRARRLVRGVAEANYVASRSYMKKHDASGQKMGWARRSPENVIRALRKGNRHLVKVIKA